MNALKGYGLVELMLGLLLSSILASLLIHLYINIKARYLKAQEQLEMNLDMLWIGDLLSHGIRAAGFTPCIGVDQLITADRRHQDKNLVSIYIDNQRPQLQINRMHETFSEALSIRNAGEITVPKSSSISKKDSILISDCLHAEVHRVETVLNENLSKRILLRKPLLFNYKSPVYVGVWLEEKWLMQSNRENKRTLYYELRHKEEVSSHIQSMQALTSTENGKMLISVILGTSEEKAWTFKAALRN